MLATLLTSALLSFAPPSPEPIPTLRDARSCAVLDEGVAVGTPSGLVRFDGEGHVTQVLTEFDGLPGARVNALKRDGRGLWVGTEGGLARVDVSSDALSMSVSQPGPAVHSLETDAGGQLWVGTWGRGLSRRDADGSVHAVAFAPDAVAPTERGAASRVARLYAREDTLWVGTGAGLFSLDLAEGAAARIERAAQLGERRGVQAIAHDGHGLYVGDLAGLRALEGDRSGSSHDVRDAAMLDGRLWLATHDAGLQPRSGRVGLGDPRGALLDLDVAADGRACAVGPDAIWVRDAEGRWRRWRPGGLASGDVSALARDGDRLWVGTFDRGLAVQTGPDAVFVDVPGVDLEVNALAKVPGVRGVFVGTADGLFHVRVAAGVGSGPGSVAFEVDRFDEKAGLASARVQALVAEAGGGLVIGTARGISRLRHGRIESVRGARSWSVFALAGDGDGGLFVGTTRGLIHLDARGHKLYFSVLSGQLPDDWITALAFAPADEYGEAALYVGTYAAGVSRLTPARGREGLAWGRAQRQDLGAGRVNIGALHVRGAWVWVGTMDALHRHDRRTSADFAARPGATLGRDVTAMTFDGNGLGVVAGRRGLVRHAFSDDAREPKGLARR